MQKDNVSSTIIMVDEQEA